MVTLRDVARLAGVSPKTVSRVVNEDSAVNEHTREAVLSAIQSLNYVPDQAARMMRTATSSVVGLITDAVATKPYSVDLIRGVHHALRESDRTLLIADSDGHTGLENDFWRVFRAHKVAGVIYATMYHQRRDLGAPDFAGPIVLTNCFSSNRDRPAILPDDEKGGYLQASYLLQRGHRRIACLSLNPLIPATGLRAEGARRAFAEGGVAFDERLLVPGFIGPVPEETLVAYEAAMTLLSGPDRPSALICGNDRIAMQVYAAAVFLGLSIPQDLSVIGFDDMPLVAETLRPELTTIGLPYFDMGRLAARTVLRLASGGSDTDGEPVLVDCPLVERHSCRFIN